nr:PREDICTED: proto-oncogene Wnt-3 [Equus przewalskii]
MIAGVECDCSGQEEIHLGRRKGCNCAVLILVRGSAQLGVPRPAEVLTGVGQRLERARKEEEGKSLALGQQYTSLGSQPLLCGSIPGLVPKQLRFCRNYIEIMPSVAEGVKLGIQECQHQFRGRRWNCTTIDDSLAIFGPVLDKATRESAFVHAIASAGVAFAVTRSCAEGTSTICGCDSHHKGPPGEGWKWGGCSEDADFGVLVSREFADARENRPDARSAMNKHNNEAGRTVSCGRPRPNPAPDPVPAPHPTPRVGPRPARPCSFQGPLCVLGNRALLFPHGQAWPAPTPHSHPFCSPSFLLGLSLVSASPGDASAWESGRPMEQCCGRGHNTRTEKRKEKCHCIFHWCCYVSCQECVRIYDVHTCK